MIRGATEGAGGTWTRTNLLDTDLGISAFGEDDQGELYVADVFGGGIYRITPATAPPTSDDFEDGDASDWTADSGSWSVVAGALQNEPARKARILSPIPSCPTCSITATFGPPGAGTDLVLIGWWKSASSHVEVIVSERRDKIILRRIVGGEVVARDAVPYPIDTDQGLTLLVDSDGRRLTVFVSGGSPTLSIRAHGLKQGLVGFAVKAARGDLATGALDQIEVE